MQRFIALFFTVLVFSILAGRQAVSAPDQRLAHSPTLATAVPTLAVPAFSPLWLPRPGTTFDWQLGDEVDTSIDVQVYDIDLFTSEANLIAALHAQGRKVICYISVGSWEDWRPDKDEFPASVIGKDYRNWKGEKWLDIRQLDLLAPIMQARLDLCQAKGFDAVEPDNIDGFGADTGFPLTYNRWLAQEAHKRDLSIGLKNDGDQAADLLQDFDWALTEDCFYQGWCHQVVPFIQAGKAVFVTEYTDTGIKLEDFCPEAKKMKFSAILKHRDLDSFRQACQ
jgi:hypothetical protein